MDSLKAECLWRHSNNGAGKKRCIINIKTDYKEQYSPSYFSTKTFSLVSQHSPQTATLQLAKHLQCSVQSHSVFSQQSNSIHIYSSIQTHSHA